MQRDTGGVILLSAGSNCQEYPSFVTPNCALSHRFTGFGSLCVWTPKPIAQDLDTSQWEEEGKESFHNCYKNFPRAIPGAGEC